MPGLYYAHAPSVMCSDWWTRVAVRTSSRGRLVVPPLHFWKGEHIREIYRCSTVHSDTNGTLCNCLELNGQRMLSNLVDSASTKRELDMKNKMFTISASDPPSIQTRNGHRWSMPERSVQKVSRKRLSECYRSNAMHKRESDIQMETPRIRRKRISTSVLSMPPTKNNNYHRKRSVMNTVGKDDTVVNSIRKSLSQNFNSDGHACENNSNAYVSKKMQCCSSCDKRKYIERTVAQNYFHKSVEEKFLKTYPNLLDLRVKLVDCRYWQHGKVQSFGTLGESLVQKKENVNGMSRSRVASSGYWLRQAKLASSATQLSLQQKNSMSGPRRVSLQPTLYGDFDFSTKKMLKREKLDSCSKSYFQIRDSRVVLSPLSSKELKLLQRGKLQLRMLKSLSRDRKETAMCRNEHTYKRQRNHSSSPTQRKRIRVSTSREKQASVKQYRKTMVIGSKIVRGIASERKKHPRSVFSTSQRKKKPRRGKHRSGSSDLFEDPLYACLLSSSESECSVRLDDVRTSYEIQSTPLSKYLDVRDESTDRVSAKSTPTRFHSKAELKQHVNKVRRMRAEKLRKSRGKGKRESEKQMSNIDGDIVEELSAFEQLKRALGLMDKVQKQICEDGYSEEERYFGDLDD